MSTLYLDCSMGAAGDMFGAALYELLGNPAHLLETVNGLGLPGVVVGVEPAERGGIVGTHLAVRVHGASETSQDLPVHTHPGKPSQVHDHDHGHGHRGLAQISELIAGLDLPAAVRSDAVAVYELLAGAEAKVHGTTVDLIHFHEVGALDAIADVVLACLLMHELRPEQVLCSAVHVGAGRVKCAHGVLPVPTPATIELLRGVPIYGGLIEAELCTPTGAALLKHFVTEFTSVMPPLVVDRVGYGMGAKQFAQANTLRAFWASATAKQGRDQVVQLSATIDDMTGEQLAHAQAELLASGALDVFTINVNMKKGRPGNLLCCLARADQADRLARQIFRQTSTLGIRRQLIDRQVLDRDIETVTTELGEVRVKRSTGWGVQRSKIEFDDLAQLAQRHDLPVDEVRARIEAHF